ncbi:hypothetical protein HNY73_001551 [Argiope bruennichi]|uniref:Uncharacterized protein n=1 Tax=Argiope bruennichi TaxID=94029 RepID=A0A8T0G2V4_ARGBR|nr:hypothetical protein HNY73_001551 [Argiope bruennichi]
MDEPSVSKSGISTVREEEVTCLGEGDTVEGFSLILHHHHKFPNPVNRESVIGWGEAPFSCCCNGLSSHGTGGRASRHQRTRKCFCFQKSSGSRSCNEPDVSGLTEARQVWVIMFTREEVTVS